MLSYRCRAVGIMAVEACVGSAVNHIAPELLARYRLSTELTHEYVLFNIFDYSWLLRSFYAIFDSPPSLRRSVTAKSDAKPS